MMKSEPHKIKIVRNICFTSLKDREKILRDAGYNVFRIPSDQVTFDMTSQGTAAMSQEQLSGIFVGDEAYAGSQNFENLQQAVKSVLGHRFVCPTHNLRGAHKLIAMTMVSEGDVMLSNSPAPEALSRERAATVNRIRSDKAPDFSGNISTDLLQKALAGPHNIPYVYIEAFAEGYHPVSLGCLKEVREIADSHNTRLLLSASRIVENALHIRENEAGYRDRPLADIVREMVVTAHVCVMDAGQAPRCNVGGLISTDDRGLHEKYQNEVVVYEGLHTYGGMAGRTMEIFARGIREMVREAQALWISEQVRQFARHLDGLPFYTGCDGVYVRADEFFPHIEAHPADTLAASLYLMAGIRALPEEDRADGKILPVQIPRLSLNNDQIFQIAEAIKALYRERENITGLTLGNRPEWQDEAEFGWEIPGIEAYGFDCAPYVIHAIEHVGVTSRKDREQAIRKAGYNTFLLRSRDVTIDLLTDSGTSAMSLEQWQRYLGGAETRASSRDFYEFVGTIREITGYRHIIPTHQGRAAEHIMSQVMIERGYVPGNMYFTTTKLHQELAGGIFADVIVDEAHVPESAFEWKGNIDIRKLEALITEHGPESLPYISFEMSVNMAGGQPFSMDNAREVYAFCRKHGIPVMFDATRAAENAYMIRKKDPRYKDWSVKSILQELFSYGDGCTVSSKKDFLVNIGGFLAYRDNKELYRKSLDMLRKYEGSVTSGGISAGDMAAHAQGAVEMVSEAYIRFRVEQTRYLGKKLLKAGVPIVEPPGTHAIFLDARRFLPHIGQDEYPAQALAAAVFVESGVRAMERGNVSKGRNPETGQNHRPALELVRLTIPRRAYTNAHMDTVAEGIIALYKRRNQIRGLRFTYEPEKLRFFQGRFEEIS